MSQEPLETREVMEKLEEIEHLGEENKAASTRTAVLASVLALFAALAALQNEHALSHGMIHKNNAILLQSQASDQWSFYQAKSMKLELVKIQTELSPQTAVKNEERVAKYEKEKETISEKAKELEKERDEQNAESTHELSRNRWFSYALTLFQVSIVLATVSLIVRRKTLWWMGLAGGITGIVLFANGFFH